MRMRSGAARALTAWVRQPPLLYLNQWRLCWSRGEPTLTPLISLPFFSTPAVSICSSSLSLLLFSLSPLFHPADLAVGTAAVLCKLCCSLPLLTARTLYSPSHSFSLLLSCRTGYRSRLLAEGQLQLAAAWAIRPLRAGASRVGAASKGWSVGYNPREFCVTLTNLQGHVKEQIFMQTRTASCCPHH